MRKLARLLLLILADHFVNHYKDHGFVIDQDEARELLGDSIVKHDTKEYSFANAAYESFDLIRVFLYFIFNKDIDFVGAGESGLRVFNRKKNN